ncbi:hypothetical protein K505DRAFT_329756 [Melanomma pulvis-pyrius CBS 109.77]|uniref:Uncharacterized protein n=1 Tax=Melanomma pulvis-pyrius CBS 109.77 TaxID=1314802 RepID=A0A6A6WU09_9PLEO|nr:hypothetical protein K505DRAFT_329756 [Melanomma pulvis-pyrius CBS 109.77]
MAYFPFSFLSRDDIKATYLSSRCVKVVKPTHKSECYSTSLELPHLSSDAHLTFPTCTAPPRISSNLDHSKHHNPNPQPTHLSPTMISMQAPTSPIHTFDPPSHSHPHTDEQSPTHAISIPPTLSFTPTTSF